MKDEQENDAMDILTRREVLSGGSLALLGAMGLSGTAAAQTGTEPRIQLGSDWEIDDFDDGSGNNNLRLRHQPSGAELVYNVTANQWELGTLDATSVTTEELPSSRVNLRTVEYDADNPNQFADVQDAISSLPARGRLYLSGRAIDIPSEGVLAVDAPITIEGDGWGGSFPKTVDGTSLLDNSSSPVAGPVVDVSGETGGGIPQTVLRDFAVAHGDGASAAVGIANSKHNIIRNVLAQLTSGGQDAFTVSGDSFFTTFQLCQADLFDRYGYHIAGNGSEHRLINCDAFGTGTRADAGANIEVANPEIKGGEFSSCRDGIWLNSATFTQGGRVVHPTIEDCTTGIRVGTASGNTWAEAHIIDPAINWSTMPSASVGVKFESSSQSRAEITHQSGATGTDQYVCEWGAGSFNDTLVTTHECLDTSANDTPLLVDAGATRPHVHVPQALSDFLIGQLPTDSNLTISVAFGTGQGGPVWHDGTDWKSVSGTTFTP